ncbi:MAG: replication restart helicase PriA [Fimbriimonadaceae bacterium]
MAVEPDERILVADVGVDARSAGSEAIYTYRANEEARPGKAYLVPLGARVMLGFVLGCRRALPSELGFPVAKLRSLGAPVPNADLPPATLQLVQETSRQTLSTLPAALGLVIPPGVKDRLTNVYRPTERAPEEKLNATLSETWRVLRQEREIRDGKGHKLQPPQKRALQELVKRGFALRQAQLEAKVPGRSLSGKVRLTADSGRIERFLKQEAKRKPAQSVTLMRLQGAESAAFELQEIKALGGVTDQTVKALLEAGLLEPVEHDPSPRRPPELNPEQKVAVEALAEAIKARTPKEFLLYGVTGSGKTEVYLHAGQEALRWGRSLLYLVPEIALTAQVVAQLRERFGASVAVLHSNMSPTERLTNWLRIRNGECSVVLGARSALFAPIPNVGLIVVDEEHESSYKQESSPRYQTKSLAAYLARLHGAPVVYGSATPSVESFRAAEEGRYELLSLPKRAARATLPQVHILDLTQAYRDRSAHVLSPLLREKMEERLEKKEQTILFLNRRAYAPSLVCRECGHRFECPHCAVALAFHRYDRTLRCHLCGYKSDPPEVCASCRGTRIRPLGVGAQKVEESVAELFSNATVARLDRDVARRKGALESTLARFRSGEIDILVGTQMVAKGLDFPNVTLVGVVAADISLNIPDFRASERTFQLLTQVAGRAGRGQRPGEVVVQTLSPDNHAVVAAKTHDYIALYEHVIKERREAVYPPFVRLVNVLATGEDRDAVFQLSTVAGVALRKVLKGEEVLGPTNCAIERIQGAWRRHLLLKLPLEADLQQIQEALKDVKDPKARLVIDVDPYSLA